MSSEISGEDIMQIVNNLIDILRSEGDENPQHTAFLMLTSGAAAIAKFSDVSEEDCLTSMRDYIAQVYEHNEDERKLN